MLMKVWQCYFENCNNDSNFQCQIPALQREREMGGGGGKKMVSVLIEFAIRWAVPDRWVMNTV